MPKDGSWGLSWEMPLEDGQIERSTLTISNGRDVLFNQSTDDHKDLYTNQYKILEDCTLADVTECGNDSWKKNNNHWDLQFS